MSEPEPEDPDLTAEAATMSQAVRMFFQLPALAFEWGRLLVRYPDEADALNTAYHELDDETSPRSPLDIVRILETRMRHSVRDPFTGRAVPGPHHRAPGESL